MLDWSSGCWEFLLVKLQQARVTDVLSHVLFSSDGSPQGFVVSPLIFSLQTDKCHIHNDMCHTIKYADDSVIVSYLSSNGSDHGDFIDRSSSSILKY